jgi:hypothetical protein
MKDSMPSEDAYTVLRVAYVIVSMRGQGSYLHFVLYIDKCRRSQLSPNP